MRTRIKICGITRPEDGCAAVELGADAVGLVFVAASSRNVDVDAAEAVVAALPPLVSVVGLFLNPAAAEVERVLGRVRLDMLQFHGDETPEFCRGFDRRYIKALAMGADADPVAYAQRYPDAAGYLLDSHVPGELGGSGQRFDWARIPSGLDKPIVLAGGLAPDNVAEAVRQYRPYAVDVSSGVEAAPGLKDRAKMAAFISEVNSVGSN